MNAAERQAKALEDAAGEVSRRACLHRQLHKTKFCTYFLKGACHYGTQCAFAHSCTELQAMPDLRKTRMCKAFAEGKCNDPNCAFAHGEQELVSTGLFHKMSLCKWNEKGKCRNGSQCRFAHGLDELRDMKKATAAAMEQAPPKAKPFEPTEPMKVTSAGAGLEPASAVALGSSLASLAATGLTEGKYSAQAPRARTKLRAAAEAWPFTQATNLDETAPTTELITPDMLAFSQALASQALAYANLQALSGTFMPKMYLGGFGDETSTPFGGYWFQQELDDAALLERLVSTQTEEFSEEKFEADDLVDVAYEAVGA